MMDIIIPSYGRATHAQQTTLRALNEAGLEPTLVVQMREHHLYEHLPAKIIALPDNIRTIAPTRQYILEHVGNDRAFCMVDDDLVFYKRRDDDRTKLRDITPTELREAFEEMDFALSNYDHVGFAAREGANRNTTGLIENTRIMRVLGYDRRPLLEGNIRFDAMEVMEDFHVALCLLEKGYANALLNDYAHNQAGSGKSGGCSHFRTPALQAANAAKLAALHPKYVKVVEKTTKGAWGGGTRVDVNIQWKKAFNGY